MRDSKAWSSPSSQWRDISFPGVVTLVLCLLRLDARQFWRDEQMTWWVTQLPETAFERMLTSVDAVMAPYYYLERTVVALAGSSPFMMRLPSALMMGLAAALLSAVGYRLITTTGTITERENARPVSLLASLAFAAIPSVSYYGQEARAYACAMAATLAATLLLLWALQEPRRLVPWIAYGLGIVAIGLTHVVALCLLAAHGVLVLSVPVLRSGAQAPASTRASAAMRERVFPWLGTVVAGLLLLSPFLWWCAGQTGQTSWIQAQWANLSNLSDTLFHQRWLGWFFIVSAFAALFRRPSALRISLAAWAFLPPILLFATRHQLHLFLHRYLLFTLPAFCLLSVLCVHDLASLLSSLVRPRARFDLSGRAPAVLSPRAAPRIAAVFVFALVASFGLRSQVKLRAVVSRNRADQLGPSQIILRERRPGDGIAFGERNTFYSRLAFRYFSRDAKDAPRDLFAAFDPAHEERFPTEGCPTTESCLPSATTRLWLLSTGTSKPALDDLSPERSQALRAQRFEVSATWAFKDVKLALLTRTLAEGGAAGGEHAQMQPSR